MAAQNIAKEKFYRKSSLLPMNPLFENIPLVNNEAAHRFELTIEGHTGLIEYSQEGNKVYLLHTEIPEALEGKGAGGALVEKTLQYIESHDQQLIPYCPFVITWLKRHPQWQRLLQADVKL